MLSTRPPLYRLWEMTPPLGSPSPPHTRAVTLFGGPAGVTRPAPPSRGGEHGVPGEQTETHAPHEELLWVQATTSCPMCVCENKITVGLTCSLWVPAGQQLVMSG